MALLAGTQAEHRYQLCADEYCDRFPCRVYKDGCRNGEQDGFSRGYETGHADGFDEGLRSCPGPHGGG